MAKVQQIAKYILGGENNYERLRLLPYEGTLSGATTKAKAYVKKSLASPDGRNYAIYDADSGACVKSDSV